MVVVEVTQRPYEASGPGAGAQAVGGQDPGAPLEALEASVVV